MAHSASVRLECMGSCVCKRGSGMNRKEMEALGCDWMGSKADLAPVWPPGTGII